MIACQNVSDFIISETFHQSSRFVNIWCGFPFFWTRRNVIIASYKTTHGPSAYWVQLWVMKCIQCLFPVSILQYNIIHCTFVVQEVNEYGQGLSIFTIILCRWQMSSGHESLNNKNRSSFLLHMLPLETRRRRNAALCVIKIH